MRWLRKLFGGGEERIPEPVMDGTPCPFGGGHRHPVNDPHWTAPTNRYPTVDRLHLTPGQQYRSQAAEPPRPPNVGSPMNVRGLMSVLAGHLADGGGDHEVFVVLESEIFTDEDQDNLAAYDWAVCSVDPAGDGDMFVLITARSIAEGDD
jgi:hypothetical protein